MRGARALLLVGWLGCDGPPALPREVIAPAGFPGQAAETAPADNALTDARVALGKRLFFDARLSRTRKVSCGTCHHPERAFAEGRAVSVGVDGRTGRRNAPALVNLAWSTSLFWDGRVPSLEEQAGKPIEDPNEMDLPLAEAARRVNDDASYRLAFQDAYGGAADEANLRRALASFVRSLVSGDSPYDRFLRGDQNALPASARRGLDLFMSDETGCFHCHPPGALTNEGFFNNGSHRDGGDPGRQAVTGRTGDLGKFRVPGLRNVEVTAPYMHDGSVPTLEAVVGQYVRGGRGHPSTDPLIHHLHLTMAEERDLVAFLRALTDRAFLTDPRLRP